MIKVTTVQYNMGNSSNKSPAKPTKPLDHRSPFGFVSECVHHAFSNDLTPSSPHSSVKGDLSSGTSDSCCSGSKSYSAIPPDKEIINDTKISKEPQNSATQSDLEGSSSSEKENHVSKEESVNPINEDENVFSKVTTKSNSLNLWNDYQQPSTSKATVTVYSHPSLKQEVEVGEYEEETYSEFDEYYEDEEFYEPNYDFDTFTNSIIVSHPHNHHFGPSVMPNQRPEKVFNPEDDENCYGDLSRLFAHLTGGHIITHRSKPLGTDSDDFDSDYDYDDVNGKGNPRILPPPTPKEDQGELGIPRTQRLNKDGDPVIEKCNCHHHQVVSTK